jgi:hypothetical protein
MTEPAHLTPMDEDEQPGPVPDLMETGDDGARASRTCMPVPLQAQNASSIYKHDFQAINICHVDDRFLLLAEYDSKPTKVGDVIDLTVRSEIPRTAHASAS